MKKGVFIGTIIVLLVLGSFYIYLDGGTTSGGYTITQNDLLQENDKYYILFGETSIEISEDLFMDIEVDEYYELYFGWHNLFKGKGKLKKLSIYKNNNKIEIYNESSTS